MTGDILFTVLIMGVLMFYTYRFGAKPTKTTLWLSAALFLISGVIWIYLQVVVTVPRPTMLLEQLLKPFIPVPDL